MADFKFKTFNENDIADMRSVFNEAFSDYLVRINLNAQNFQRKIIEKTGVSFNHSIGCQINNQWISFIFNSLNPYENKLSAYNGGTGVIPEFRGNKLTEKMYDFIMPDLLKAGVKQCVLEVVSDNIPALKSYRKAGFRKSKFLHCMKIENNYKYLDKRNNSEIKVKNVKEPDWNLYNSFCDYKSSFLDSLFMLEKNKHNETFLEIGSEDQLLGFIVVNKYMGRIGHIGVNPDHRGKGIGTSLINQARKLCGKKQLYVLNVNEKSYGLLSFFLRVGFKNDLDQFELKLKLV